MNICTQLPHLAARVCVMPHLLLTCQSVAIVKSYHRRLTTAAAHGEYNHLFAFWSPTHTTEPHPKSYNLPFPHAMGREKKEVSLLRPSV